MDPRIHALAELRREEDILRMLDRVRAALRTDREQWGPYTPNENEVNRLGGMLLAGRWLLDRRETVGPLSDGPADSVDRVRREYELALELLPNGVSPTPRFAPKSAPGYRQRWQAEVQGIGHLLGWTLRLFQIPGFPDEQRTPVAA